MLIRYVKHATTKIVKLGKVHFSEIVLTNLKIFRKVRKILRGCTIVRL